MFERLRSCFRRRRQRRAGTLHLVSPPPPGKTSKLILESWLMSHANNARAGDVMELRWLDRSAKAFIGWWDYTDPDNPSLKAWIGTHDQATNPKSDPHRHISIEVPDSRGHMQTRFAIPYDLDHTNITVSQADLTVGGTGVLRVSGRSALEFARRRNAPHRPRWRVALVRDDLVVSRHGPEGEDAHPVARFRQDGSVEVNALVLVDEVTDERWRVVVRDGVLQPIEAESPE